MENWIDLKEIPKYKGTGTRGKLVNDWKNAYGCKCNFYCEGVSGFFTIKEYYKDKQTVCVNYNDKDKIIPTSYILSNNIRTLIGLRNKDFKIQIGVEFIDNNRNIKITGRKMIQDTSGVVRKFYNYHCNICNWSDGWIMENHLLKGTGCSCCAKISIVPFFNDIYTTNPEFIPYFKHIEDTHKTTYCSKRKFLMVCPNCRNEQLYSTDKLSSYGFSCKKCGDGYSYGEKFVYSLLNSLGIEFTTQLSNTIFNWCNKYKYDFYLTNINTIIEVHGRQHYFPKSTKELYGYCQENDVVKEKLAKENGIDNYIIIDCKKSELSYMKNSIIKSGLLELLHKNHDEINWQECDSFTSKSFIVSICEYKNNHPELSTTDIGKIFHMARTTIQSYLQKGSILGICIYDKEFERKFKTKKAKLEYYNDILNKENLA